MKILAAIAKGAGQAFELGEVELEAPRDGEVLVRIAGVGLCHTDLFVRDHGFVPFPAVLGHEGAGTVEAIGPGVTRLAVGDRVVLTFGSCGQCASCASDRPAYCAEFGTINLSGRRPDGSPLMSGAQGGFFKQSSFASHALVSERNAVKVETVMPLALLGPLGCGFQTGAGAIMNVLKPEPGRALAIVGAGSVGLAALLAARRAGCSPLIVVDRHKMRLGIAADLGATRIINTRSALDLSAALISTSGGGGCTYVLETTGVPALSEAAIASLAVGGTCALVGASLPGVTARIDLSMMLSGRSVRGVIEGDSDPPVFIPHLVKLMSDGSLPLQRLIRTYPLAEINAAVADVETGRTVKAVLLPP